MHAPSRKPVDAVLASQGEQWPGRGTSLSGRYRLEEFLAVGGSAVVWRARDLRLHRQVAIKILLPSRALDSVSSERFQREARATVRATHPNAVRVYDAATDGTMTYLVMELVEGPSLTACNLPLDPEVAAAVGAQVGAALGAAHARDMVHRDVKPGNVLVETSGWIKVVDFGIARVLDAPSGLTQPGLGMGTARYVAPEQVLDEQIGPWTDVYGLGLTLWEALVGRPAFVGDDVYSTAIARVEQDVPDVRDEAPDVPAALADVITRCTQRDPAARFSDGTAAADAFGEVSGPRPYDLTRRLLDGYRPVPQGLPPTVSQPARGADEVAPSSGGPGGPADGTA